MSAPARGNAAAPSFALYLKEEAELGLTGSR